MKTLLIVKSVVEVGAGLALLLVPSMVVSLALGIPLERPGVIALARFVGVVLLAVGIACWMARNHSGSRGAIGLIVGLLAYDVSVVALLLVARLAEQLSGIALWPAVFLHSGLGLWSLLSLRKKQ
ncbi:MAG: hypothetical protein WA477_24210 [Candidatus Sulfotelmatobacter sp.]